MKTTKAAALALTPAVGLAGSGPPIVNAFTCTPWIDNRKWPNSGVLDVRASAHSFSAAGPDFAIFISNSRYWSALPEIEIDDTMVGIVTLHTGASYYEVGPNGSTDDALGGPHAIVKKKIRCRVELILAQ